MSSNNPFLWYIANISSWAISSSPTRQACISAFITCCRKQPHWWLNPNQRLSPPLTQVTDTKTHGLPMDRIYCAELNALRRKGRKIAELCALVTSSNLRWKNLFMQMSRIIYQHALCSGIDDFCIMVNPKHVGFYKLIFLFEPLGSEKHYPALGVPAVALRADLNKAKARFEDKYGTLRHDCDLHAYLHTSAGAESAPWFYNLQPPEQISPETMSSFGWNQLTIEPIQKQALLRPDLPRLLSTFFRKYRVMSFYFVTETAWLPML